MQKLAIISTPVAQAEEKPDTRQKRHCYKSVFFPKKIFVVGKRGESKSIKEAFNRQREHSGRKSTMRRSAFAPADDEGRCAGKKCADKRGQGGHIHGVKSRAPGCKIKNFWAGKNPCPKSSGMSLKLSEHQLFDHAKAEHSNTQQHRGRSAVGNRAASTGCGLEGKDRPESSRSTRV